MKLIKSINTTIKKNQQLEKQDADFECKIIPKLHKIHRLKVYQSKNNGHDLCARPTGILSIMLKH